MTDFITFGDVEVVSVISGNSTEQARISGRPSHAFIYKVSGESVYYLRDKQINHKAGTLLYIPEGESYEFKKISTEATHRLVNFHARIDTDICPKLFSVVDGESISALLRQMEKSWRFEQSLAGKYETLSSFYKLLANLASLQQSEYIRGSKKELIAPAVDYLEKHIFDSDLKASELPALCGMSAPTFRKIFCARFGASPRKYIISQRLMQAKIILEGGEYKNISEVAFSVGYDDPLYFSKHFKSVYGIAPSMF